MWACEGPANPNKYSSCKENPKKKPAQSEKTMLTCASFKLWIFIDSRLGFEDKTVERKNIIGCISYDLYHSHLAKL